ncbi:lipopolysaccharide biosynthesis protein [Chryseobacterium salivictor]|uniref:Teichuronic acid biosynthesis protein TuaB n=1 Tax=Chryseobacterium salivictor TaxID=2547600 RepID=A0A4P6ZIU1_9FLAO|nr:lipopolysaccharide biosynthesis protein [Chryseobacterium salivictor]QBO59683.1 Teichuronic acid biosynthesis protein TuaB [Chryseobacterium salivictor]
MENIKSKVLSGLFWQYLQRFSTQGIQLLISIILARLLLPKDFGVIALIGVFITMSSVLIDSGFSNALIQKKEADNKDFSSVFILNLVLSLFLYSVLFFIAPWVAQFYEEPLLTPVLRVIGLTIVLNALTIIQTVVLSREMQFRKSFNINVVSTIISGFIGIGMAYSGYGVWSLVFSQLTARIVSTGLLWYYIRWKPALIFSLNRIKILFHYGSKILLGALFNTLYNNVYAIVIGKQYNSTVLGYYNRGALMPTLVVDSISNSLGAVMFPALSAHQNDKPAIKRMVKRMLQNSAAIVFFLMAVLIVIAEPLVSILLTDKWLPAVPYLQLVSITVAFYPLIAINASAITSVGKSGKYLQVTMISKLLSLALIVAAIPFGVYTMVVAGAVASFVSTFVSAWPSKAAIGYSAFEQWKDVLPIFILAIVSGLAAWPVSYLGLNHWVTLFAQSAITSLIYFTGAYLLKLQLLIDLQQLIKQRR